MDPAQFISTHAAAVIENSPGGLFPSVTMAQMALESAWGESALSRNHNNYFGIKQGSTWKGPVTYQTTNEVIQGGSVQTSAYFRVYSSPADSLKDRAALLHTARYRAVLTAPDPETQGAELYRAGYATDPKYPDKLITLINQHNLKELDKKKRP